MNQVVLFSSVEIARSDLVNFLFQVGVQHNENSHRLSDYFLHTGKATVWIDLDNREPHYPNPEIDALIEQKLDGPPRVDILLHIMSGPESEQLALDFACQLAQRWPFVLDNNSGLARRIFSLEELQNLRKKRLGFWEDEKSVPQPKDQGDDITYIPPQQIEEYKSRGEPLPDWIREELERQGLSETEARGNREHNENYLSEVRNLLDQGREMEAVKLYRQSTGVSLREAKKSVDRMKSEPPQ